MTDTVINVNNSDKLDEWFAVDDQIKSMTIDDTCFIFFRFWPRSRAPRLISVLSVSAKCESHQGYLP